MNDHRFVFVGGLHRSGTTLLARALATHPDIAGFHDTGAIEDEGQHLQSVYPPAAAFGGVGRFALDPRARLTESSRLATVANAERLFSQWAAHWDLSRPVLLEKSPPNLIRSRFLQALFPRAAFVFVVRHPLAVALASRKWARGAPIGRLLRHWLQAHELMRRDLPLLERAVVVAYERLAAHPADELARALRGLDLPPHNIALDVRTDVNEAYFAEWRAMTRSLSGRLRRARVETRFERDAGRFGYSLRHPGPPSDAWPWAEFPRHEP